MSSRVRSRRSAWRPGRRHRAFRAHGQGERRRTRRERLPRPHGYPRVSTSRFTDLGSKAIGRSSVFFDDVRIPCVAPPCRRRLWLHPGHARLRFQPRPHWSSMRGCGPGLARRSWAYVQQREAFGAPLAKNQGITFPLAEGEGHIAAIRQLCLHTLAPRAPASLIRRRRPCASGSPPRRRSTSFISAS